MVKPDKRAKAAEGTGNGRPSLPKALVFMRHGIAVDAVEFAGPDADRPLTRKGRKRAAAVADRLVRAWPPDVVVTSPRVRARQTAEAVLTSPHGPATAPEVVVTDALAPDGDVGAWLEFLESWRKSRPEGDIVWVVGHETQLGRIFAAHLGCAGPFPFKKAGVGVVAPTSLCDGELIAFIPPRALLTGEG